MHSRRGAIGCAEELRSAPLPRPAGVSKAAPGQGATANVGVVVARRPAIGSMPAPMVATFERVVSEGEVGSAPVLFARLTDCFVFVHVIDAARAV